MNMNELIVCCVVLMFTIFSSRSSGEDRAAPSTQPSPLDFTVKDIDGKQQNLADYKGKVVMIVNVASQCGFTPQYAGLQALQAAYDRLGFSVLAFPCNQCGAQEQGTEAEIGDFAAQVAAKGPDTIALVFYAGHGLQIDGENFLVPVDVDPKREADIPVQAVRLNDILNTLTSVPSRMRIVLLDACRNNPFPAINQSAGHGLAIVDAKIGAPGTFVSFSTSPGAEAEDGSGADSPYTSALLLAAKEPGLSIEDTATAMGVSAATVKREWASAKAWLSRELRESS